MAEIEETKEIPAIKERGAFSGWPMMIGWLAMLIFTFYSCTRMVGAGDTWVALACGRHFINHGVNTVEPFSANSHKAGPTAEEVATWPGWAQQITDVVGLDTVKYWHPTGWINQNWLTHVIFYWLTHLSPFADADEWSFNSLVYWKFAIYMLTMVCVYYTCRLLRVNPALAAMFSCFALFVGRTFFDIRPAGFSNLLVAVYLLVLVLTMYRNILYIWLIVPIVVLWCNLHGGYLYLFIMLVPFFGINLLTFKSKKLFVTTGLKGLYHTAAAGVVSFIAMVVFNPFHLTNLSHTFMISLSKHAEKWRTVNEWHPAFEWNNPVGDEIPFLVMYIICWLVLVVWLGTMIATRRTVKKNKPKRWKEEKNGYQWPKINLVLFVIAGLTIYMAIRSRRFIPIAGIVACPVIAMLIDQMIRAISATVNFMRNNRLEVPPMQPKVQKVIIGLGCGAVLYFGIWWGVKIKQVYIDPWPTDEVLNSVFMRMTASDAKPFYAMRFIKENKLSGKMFNYWTEGGFIAWGQEPDPNTGKTPLQLFMDGRAQAAYDRKDYDSWTEIMSGGPVVQSSRIRGQRLSREDYRNVGKWISKKLRKRDVWLAMMPTKEFSSPFTRGIEHNREWFLPFFNDKMKIFVDVKHPKGQKLFEDMISGKLKYPDKFSENLIISRNLFNYSKEENSKKQGFAYALKALVEKPSQASMLQVVRGDRFPQIRSDVVKACEFYLQEYEKNKDQWSKKPGYHNKIVAALIGLDYLQKLSAQKNDKNAVEFYAQKKQQCDSERAELFKNKRW